MEKVGREFLYCVGEGQKKKSPHHYLPQIQTLKDPHFL